MQASLPANNHQVMSNKNKLQKFAELNTFGNVFQNTNPLAPQLKTGDGEDINYKGAWNQHYFKREAPLVLELACGKAEYTLGLASLMPERNYMGVDIKGNRIWKGAGKAWQQRLQHVGFLRTPIEQLPYFLGHDEVSEIWITFPDPHPRKGRARKRLTSPVFLRYYLQFLKPGGIVNLKTDADSLYDYTLEVIQECNLPIIRQVDDVYREAPDDPVLTICTFYEEMHLAAGKTIHYVSFQIDPLRDH